MKILILKGILMTLRLMPRYVALLVSLSMTVLTAPSLAWDWVVDILPGALHANFAADDFSVTGPNGKETTSIMSAMPSVAGGVAFDYGSGYLDLKLGAGMLLNAKLGAMLINGNVGLYEEVKPSVYIGPHIAIGYYMNPEWWGDTDIEFDNNMGWLFGLHVAAGDRITYILSADYLSTGFDINHLGPGVTASDDRLDMAGIAVQFGVRAQF